MPDALKNTLDLKTVVTLIVFIAGLVANNVKNKYEQELAIEKISAEFNSRIDKVESNTKNRDDLQDRDIKDISNQQRLDEEVIKSQNFLISNFSKNK
jgi:hypothetical protein